MLPPSARHAGPPIPVARLVRRLQLRHKISLGFLCVLATLLAVGSINYIGFARVGQQNDVYTDAMTLVDATSEIDRAVLNLRLRVLEFVKSGQDRQAELIVTAAAAATATLDSAARILRAPGQADAVAAIRADLDRYVDDTKKVVARHRERARLVRETIVTRGAQLQTRLGIFVEGARYAEATFAADRAGALLNKFVGYRFDVSILVQGWNADVAALAERTAAEIAGIADAVEALANGTPVADDAKSLQTDIKSFIADATAAVEATSALNKLIDGPMAESGRAIGAKAEALRQDGFATRAAIRAETHAFIGRSSALSLGLCLGGLALGLALAWLMGRSISRPIAAMTGAMEKLADGDHKTPVPTVGRSDEIGKMAAAVQVFKENALEFERVQREREAERDRASAERRAARTKLADQFQASVRGVVDAVSGSAASLARSAATFTETARQADERAGAVASASEAASSNVQTVAAAAEELSVSIREITQQVVHSAELASRAVNEADRTNATVQSLSSAAQKIGDVVKLINDIAGQTNLLALNATIEAARAGDAGKGFAVVASEVKSLATQTAQATEDIANQVADIREATKQSVNAIGGIGKTIRDIHETATAIAASVEEQGAATQEIARNVQQAAVGTNEVTSHIGGVRESAGETGKAAVLVRAAADDLTRQSGMLTEAVDSFLASIRAA